MKTKAIRYFQTDRTLTRIVSPPLQGFSRDMADMLLNDIKNAICEFEKLEYPTPTRIAQDKNIAVKGTVFTHNAHSNAAKK